MIPSPALMTANENDAKPVKLSVTFEADDDASLVEAIESFLQNVVADSGKQGSASSMSTSGWRYKVDVGP